MEFNKTQMKRIMWLITFAVLLTAFSQHFNTAKQIYFFVVNITMPFISGLCIAFVVNVLMRPIENKLFKFIDNIKNEKAKKIWSKLKRPFSIVIAYLVIFGFVAFLIFLLVPQLQKSVLIIIDKLPEYLNNAKAWVLDLYKRLKLSSKQIQNFDFDWNKVYEFISSNVKKTNDNYSLFNKTIGITTSIFNTLFNFFFGIIFATFVLMNKEKLSKQCKKLLYAYLKEHHANSISRVLSVSYKSFSKFISGQCLDALLVAILCFVGMIILKIPYAALISTVIGFTALIPVIGAFLGTVVGAMLIILVNPIKALWFVIYIIVLQQIESNLIYPKIVGKSVGLPAIWMIVAATLGGSLLGIIGVILSVPIVSIVYTLLRESTHRRLKQKGITIE